MVRFNSSAINEESSNPENSRVRRRRVCGSEQRTDMLTGFRTSYWERQNITEDLGERKII